MGNWVPKNDCPDLYTGENCTEQWRDYLSPQADIFRWLNVSMFGFCTLCSLYIVWQTFHEKGWDLEKVSRLRLNTVICALISSSSFTVMWVLGGGILFPFDAIESKLTVCFMWMGMTFFFQTANWLAVMYIDLMANTLEKKGIMDHVDVSTVRKVAMLYPVYVAMIVSFVLIFLEVINGITSTSRVLIGTAAYPLFIAITICSHYYGRLGQVLNKAIGAADKSRFTHKDMYSQWKKIARTAIILRYYALIVGTPALVLVVASVALDWYSNPDFYFFFVHITAGIGIVIPLFVFILQFTRNFACCAIQIESFRISRRLSKINSYLTSATPRATTTTENNPTVNPDTLSL